MQNLAQQKAVPILCLGQRLCRQTSHALRCTNRHQGDIHACQLRESAALRGRNSSWHAD